jgi:hypothetical protein
MICFRKIVIKKAMWNWVHCITLNKSSIITVIILWCIQRFIHIFTMYSEIYTYIYLLKFCITHFLMMLCIVKYHIFLFFSDSKLTHLLKEELGGNCKTKALVCLTPQADPNIVSSILTFSTRVGQVKNFPIVNDTFAQVISFIQMLLNILYFYTIANLQIYSVWIFFTGYLFS